MQIPPTFWQESTLIDPSDLEGQGDQKGMIQVRL